MSPSRASPAQWAVTEAGDRPVTRAMVLRATGPCSSTDRSTTLALVRRGSLSAARGTGEERDGRGERRGTEGERVGAAAVRGIVIILGYGSDTAPS